MQPLHAFLEKLDPALRPHHAKIIGVLKQTGELSLHELTAHIEVSYTGLRTHCERLCNGGFLSRRRASSAKVGRPVLLYRLGPESKIFFPTEVSDTLLELLEASSSVFGQSAPERLLMQCFKTRRDLIADRVRKGTSVVDRASRLIDERQKLGHLADCEYDPKIGFTIREYHHPLADIIEKYPTTIRMEIQGMESLVGTWIRRKANEFSTTYLINTLGVE